MYIANEEKITYDDVILKPKQCIVKSRSEIGLETILCNGVVIEHPVISANMYSITEDKMALAMYNSKSVGVIHRFMDIDKFCRILTKLLEEKHRLIAFSVGVKDFSENENSLTKDMLWYAHELRSKSKVDCTYVVFIDLANGFDQRAVGVCKYIKTNYQKKFKVIIGNICTPEAIRFFESFDTPVDGFKCGVGGGSVCTTRTITGHGYPQLSAIIEASQATTLPIIADGGIRNSGDVVKALAAGASTVMCGRLFAGTYEAAEKNTYRGNSSKFIIDNFNSTSKHIPTAEGVETNIESQNRSAEDIMNELAKGIKSGISYSGARDIASLRQNAVFIKQTRASYAEGLTR